MTASLVLDYIIFSSALVRPVDHTSAEDAMMCLVPETQSLVLDLRHKRASFKAGSVRGRYGSLLSPGKIRE